MSYSIGWCARRRSVGGAEGRIAVRAPRPILTDPAVLCTARRTTRREWCRPPPKEAEGGRRRAKEGAGTNKADLLVYLSEEPVAPMFENIIGQQEAVSTLKEEIEGGVMPPALLFHGPLYSGKLSTALEVARGLSCETGIGAWDCRCSSCEQHRRLIHPGTLLFGPKDVSLEIHAAADVLRRERRPGACYLFIRAVRKLVGRFDPLLWEEEQSRIGTALQAVREIEEALQSLSPRGDLAERKGLDEEVEEIVELCAKAIPSLPKDNIPINHIRRVSYWVHLASPARRKVVILEGADRMQEASRNALLKTLEEPPGDTTFILVTPRKGLLLQTIISRLRCYGFKERPEEEQREVLERVFREREGMFHTLRQYFLAWKGVNPAELRDLARRFLELVMERDASDGSALEEMQSLLASRKRTEHEEIVSDFGEELMILLRSALWRGSPSEGNDGPAAEDPPLERVEAWSDMLGQSLSRMKSLNMNPELVLESLYYRMRRVP